MIRNLLQEGRCRGVVFGRGGACVVWMLALAVLGLADAAFGQACPSYIVAAPKGQALHLFFPTSDSTFTVGGTTYSIGDFDAADLDSSIGTTAQLRNRIFEIVRDTYCELSVDVKQTTSVPSPSEARWQVLGMGTDTGVEGAFGRSFGVDMGDSEGQDFARIWAEQFDVDYGSAGGPLEGTNSTLERWAVAIGGTAAHEGAHNYGLNHSDATPRSGTTEDATLNHVMATASDFGSTDFESGDNRAKRIRHFSDKSFEILGHNIGLNFATLSNWDFVNPNDTNATGLKIKLLSTASSLTRGWFYTGTLSPWTDPTLTKLAGTQTFQGTAYNVYELDFSVAKPWSGGADGTVPPAEKFHVGAAVSDAILVYEVTLRNGSGDLPLKPRMFGYDAGTDDMDGDGDFAVTFFNPDPALGNLILRDVQVLFLPRPVDINNMVVGGELVSREGLPVLAFPRRPGEREGRGDGTTAGGERQPGLGIRDRIRELTLGRNPVSVPIARFSDQRHVDVVYDSAGCTPGIRTASGFTPFEADIARGEVIECPDGPALSLFPATYTYVIATVIDPNARHWDPVQGRFVTGPLETRLFYQFAGIVPDFNDNGTDDLTDIREGVSPDGNGNGIPDEAERGTRGLAVSARVGATLPQGSALDPGLSFNLGLERYVTPNITIEGIFGYHDFAGSGAGLEAWQLSLNSRFYLPAYGLLKLYANAGLGAYNLDPGGTELGYNLGVGADYELRPRLALEGAYNYHDVDPGSTSLEFSTLQIGLRWRL